MTDAESQKPSPVRDTKSLNLFICFRQRGFIIATAVVVVCFCRPLFELAKFAGGSSLYSHIFLIPVISVYLIWDRKKDLPAACSTSSSSRSKWVAPFLIGGTALEAIYWFGRSPVMTIDDYLAAHVFSFLLFFWAICAYFLRQSVIRTILFPLFFLIFLVPVPTFLLDGIVLFLQHTSALAAWIMYKMVGIPVLLSDLTFTLPAGIGLHVAPECSGIHSTLVLFITSVVAGYLFLRSPWKRSVLVLAVIPLAILRNGFRIFTIGELCVHIGPQMIDSPIHHRGGPIFFALSLVPFFLLLYFLRRSDFKKSHIRIPNQES